MKLEKFKSKMSHMASKGKEFLFIIDFKCEKPLLYTFEEAKKRGIFFDIKGVSNKSFSRAKKIENMQIKPLSKDKYGVQFNKVRQELRDGNSYLLNLTASSNIFTKSSLKNIYKASKADYKLLYKDKFVVFSPECFVNIIDDKIYTYPMKGTIRADIKNAKKVLLEDEKEICEHNTIVDLMRNDLSMIAKNVKVKKYRYVQKIKTNSGEILQTSSKIKAKMRKGWQQSLGEDFLKLLPAGSICGAPKEKTLQIIQEVESYKRGYYSGVFGIFDGVSLKSAVMIRFIERQKDSFVFKSGGGITTQSRLEDEYNELLQKIYIPIV